MRYGNVNTVYKLKLYFNPFQSVDINPEYTQGVRGKVMLDDYMEMVLSNRGKVTSTIPSLPDITQSFAIG